MKLNLHFQGLGGGKTKTKILVFCACLAVFSGSTGLILASETRTKEKNQEETSDQNNSGVEKYICEKDITTRSISDPKIELLRLTDLCKNNLKEETEENETEIAYDQLHDEVSDILKSTPMQPMIDDIAEKDRVVAGFLVGIALKESGLGVHAPSKGGKDCFNYWGYKGGINPTSGGYSCFSSPGQAVEVVGGRIEDLVAKKIDTPSEMLVWKCGSSCAGHSPSGVAKWVSDVSIYFNKLKG